jgi:hypothetical protein
VIVGVDPPTNVGEDKGADRETRRRPCTRRTWCINEIDHAGDCVEVVSTPVPRSDFGPRRKR